MPSCMYWNHVLQWYYTNVLLIIDFCTNTYYVLVCTTMYWYVLSDWYVQVWNMASCQEGRQYCTKGCLAILSSPRRMLWYQYVLIHTSMYLYVLVKTATSSWLCPSHTWVVYLWRSLRLPWRKTMCARNRSSVQWRLVGVGKRIECDAIEACLWLMSIHACTSTYRSTDIELIAQT